MTLETKERYNMLTPSEYLKNGVPKNQELWLNGIDIVAHCLQKDYSQSFYQDSSPSTQRYDDWADAMQSKVIIDDGFQDIYDNAYAPKKRWFSTFDDTGAFDVSSYISKEEFCFENERAIKSNYDALSIIIDMMVPYGDRDCPYMVNRHKKVYELIAQCDSDSRPVQVVAVQNIKIPELNETLKMFIIVKDYTDTIFPSIWGSLKNNESANNFCNVLMDYFIGTTIKGNGTPTTLEHAEKYFSDNEELIIFGSRINANNAKIIGD